MPPKWHVLLMQIVFSIHALNTFRKMWAAVNIGGCQSPRTFCGWLLLGSSQLTFLMMFPQVLPLSVVHLKSYLSNTIYSTKPSSYLKFSCISPGMKHLFNNFQDYLNHHLSERIWEAPKVFRKWLCVVFLPKAWMHWKSWLSAAETPTFNCSAKIQLTPGYQNVASDLPRESSLWLQLGFLFTKQF